MNILRYYNLNLAFSCKLLAVKFESERVEHCHQASPSGHYIDKLLEGLRDISTHNNPTLGKYNTFLQQIFIL